jgi:hypothetical protein
MARCGAVPGGPFRYLAAYSMHFSAVLRRKGVPMARLVME